MTLTLIELFQWLASKDGSIDWQQGFTSPVAAVFWWEGQPGTRDRKIIREPVDRRCIEDVDLMQATLEALLYKAWGQSQDAVTREQVWELLNNAWNGDFQALLLGPTDEVAEDLCNCWPGPTPVTVELLRPFVRSWQEDKGVTALI